MHYRANSVEGHTKAQSKLKRNNKQNGLDSTINKSMQMKFNVEIDEYLKKHLSKSNYSNYKKYQELLLKEAKLTRISEGIEDELKLKEFRSMFKHIKKEKEKIMVERQTCSELSDTHRLKDGIKFQKESGRQRNARLQRDLRRQKDTRLQRNRLQAYFQGRTEKFREDGRLQRPISHQCALRLSKILGYEEEQSMESIYQQVKQQQTALSTLFLRLLQLTETRLSDSLQIGDILQQIRVAYTERNQLKARNEEFVKEMLKSQKECLKLSRQLCALQEEFQCLVEEKLVLENTISKMQVQQSKTKAKIEAAKENALSVCEDILRFKLMAKSFSATATAQFSLIWHCFTEAIDLLQTRTSKFKDNLQIQQSNLPHILFMPIQTELAILPITISAQTDQFAFQSNEVISQTDNINIKQAQIQCEIGQLSVQVKMKTQKIQIQTLQIQQFLQQHNGMIEKLEDNHQKQRIGGIQIIMNDNSVQTENIITIIQAKKIGIDGIIQTQNEAKIDQIIQTEIMGKRTISMQTIIINLGNKSIQTADVMKFHSSMQTHRDAQNQVEIQTDNGIYQNRMQILQIAPQIQIEAKVIESTGIQTDKNNTQAPITILQQTVDISINQMVKELVNFATNTDCLKQAQAGIQTDVLQCQRPLEDKHLQNNQVQSSFQQLGAVCWSCKCKSGQMQLEINSKEMEKAQSGNQVCASNLRNQQISKGETSSHKGINLMPNQYKKYQSLSKEKKVTEIMSRNSRLQNIDVGIQRQREAACSVGTDAIDLAEQSFICQEVYLLRYQLNEALQQNQQLRLYIMDNYKRDDNSEEMPLTEELRLEEKMQDQVRRNDSQEEENIFHF